VAILPELKSIAYGKKEKKEAFKERDEG